MPGLFGVEGEGAVGAVAASCRQLPQTWLVRVDQREVGARVQLRGRPRPQQKRGGLVLAMLPSWQIRCLYADLRGWQHGARV